MIQLDRFTVKIKGNLSSILFHNIQPSDQEAEITANHQILIQVQRMMRAGNLLYMMAIEEQWKIRV